MAAERLSMRKIKEVLRLDAAGQSQRAIARSVMVARSTVKEYLQRAAAAGLSWPMPDHLSDTALEVLLFSYGSYAGGRQGRAGLASHLRRDEGEGPDGRHAATALARIQGGQSRRSAVQPFLRSLPPLARGSRPGAAPGA